MTIETACALPLFILALISVISIIQMINIHADIEAAIHQVGREMSVYAYAYENGIKAGNTEDAGVGEQIFSDLFIWESVINYLGRDTLDASVIKGGSKGISFWETKVLENDLIDITASYQVSALSALPGLPAIRLKNHCVMHIWNGYDNSKGYAADTEDDIVYITETGTVYHKSRSCTYLTLSIASVLPRGLKQ